MIIKNGDLFVTNNNEVLISNDYVNTTKEAWSFEAELFKDNDKWSKLKLVHTSIVKEVITKEKNPEYFL